MAFYTLFSWVMVSYYMETKRLLVAKRVNIIVQLSFLLDNKKSYKILQIKHNFLMQRIHNMHSEIYVFHVTFFSNLFILRKKVHNYLNYQ